MAFILVLRSGIPSPPFSLVSVVESSLINPLWFPFQKKSFIVFVISLSMWSGMPFTAARNQLLDVTNAFTLFPAGWGASQPRHPLLFFAFLRFYSICLLLLFHF